MKRFITSAALFAMLLFGMATMTGCYFHRQVQQHELGLRMRDGVSIDDVVGAGRYTAWSPWARLERIDTSVKTTEWTGADVWTSDRQPVVFTITVSYSRSRENVRTLWDMFRLEAQDNDALEALVHSRIPRVIRNVSTTMSLYDMLGIAPPTADDETAPVAQRAMGREVLTQAIFDQLQRELATAGIDLHDVGVNDIAADPGYVAMLVERAQAGVRVDLAQARTRELQEQLVQEQAQTNIDIEIARRHNQVMAEENRLFLDAPEILELERLRIIASAIRPTDTIYFVPEGTSISMILQQAAGTGAPAPLPLPANNE